MSRIKKFPVTISGVNGACKRSITMSQVEVLFIVCADVKIEEHRKYFNLKLTFRGTEFNKSVVVKDLPKGYLNKFLLQ